MTKFSSLARRLSAPRAKRAAAGRRSFGCPAGCSKPAAARGFSTEVDSPFPFPKETLPTAVDHGPTDSGCVAHPNDLGLLGEVLHATSDRPEPRNAAISVFEMFSIGIGPSSSHTVGPMRAAKKFAESVKSNERLLELTEAVHVELFGSLACTGVGHHTPQAVVVGLEGHEPETVDPLHVFPRFQEVSREEELHLGGKKWVKFKEINFRMRDFLLFHSNGIRFWCLDENRDMLFTQEYFSVGGGFIVDGSSSCHPDLDPSTKTDKTALIGANGSEVVAKNMETDALVTNAPPVFKAVHEFYSASELFAKAAQHNCQVSDLIWKNELSWLTDEQIRQRALNIWKVMVASIDKALQTEGTLPGGLGVTRRAAKLKRMLMQGGTLATSAEWLSCWAMAVNEENACGGRVVTAPTNGAAGVIPATIKYAVEILGKNTEDDIIRMMFTMGAIGMIYRQNASISAAEVGCQGEIGVASSMAAAGICEILGGKLNHVENAAEIAMEHSLGLTCDPVGGLVQIPCIERNAMGANKAVQAARLAMLCSEHQRIRLDQVVETMRQTGKDMMLKYKETSTGGLAVNVPLC